MLFVFNPNIRMIKIEHEFHELTECGWMPMQIIRVIRVIRVEVSQV